MTSRLKIAVQIAARLILWVLSISFFGIAAWLLIEDKTGSASTSAGFGTILLFLINLDRIESFKGFGLEAKTRDLRSAIIDAENLLSKFEEMRTEVTSLSENINTLHVQLDETRTIAQRAQAIAFMAQ